LTRRIAGRGCATERDYMEHEDAFISDANGPTPRDEDKLEAFSN
jgi:hypothetical protein